MLRNTPLQHYALGVTLNNEITSKKHKNAKKVAPSRLQKWHLFLAWELKQEGRMWPCSTLAGNVCNRGLKIFAALHMHRSMKDWEGSESSDLGVQLSFSE